MFLGIGLAHADLLENYDQLKQRYGDPVSHTVSDDGTLFTFYRWSPFCVLVGFLQGCSHHEAFKRLDGAPMTAADKDKCLPFEKWKKVSVLSLMFTESIISRSKKMVGMHSAAA